MLTRGGIETNLKKSPYVYNHGGFILHFSSKLYLSKFTKNVLMFHVEQNKKFKNKYGMECIPFSISGLMLYSEIEKRGFYVTMNGVELLCLDNLRLGGVTAIKIE